MSRRFARRAFAKEDDVGNDSRALTLESVRRQPDCPDEVGLRAEILADGGVDLVEREVARDESENATGAQSIDRLGKEVIVQ